MNTMQNLPLTRLKLRLRTLEPVPLPHFPGSVFRGGFGMALRRACCTMNRQDCKNCMLRTSCVYATVFETGGGQLSGDSYQLSDAPRPFIIEPPFPVPLPLRAGDCFECGLVLMGPSVEQLPYFVYAFSKLGQAGIGPQRGKFRIAEITTASDQGEIQIFDGVKDCFVNPVPLRQMADFFSADTNADSATLTFLTPTRIKDQNRLTKDLSFALLMRNLLRRISILTDLCTGTPFQADFKELIRRAGEIQTAESHLHWYDWKRYSARQKDSMKLGGFLGTVTCQGDLSPFIPFLRIGEFLHIGKACTFGLGRYNVEW
ncbi:MAG: CRISPR system precrRNA processing endoribonuclease RAMP protein Cas6 [Desulfococcaceae bacterium]|nr:CRISPR system precrRNA processing endoribonuclease RAMP protein Cas6 [Desulfococcaceae bacterium]